VPSISILFACDPSHEDLLIADLHEAGTTGITEEPGGLRAFFADEAPAPELLDRFASFQPQLRHEENIDWEQATRDAWPAVLVGERFFLAPSWNTDRTPAGRIRLEIHPGMACGTGWHPCTQLCIEALERHISPGMTVLDVGSGSGILSDAARLLGAARVIGCDVDFDAVQIALEHVDVPVFAGSASAVRAGVADAIVANISSGVAEMLAYEFDRVGREDSILILSGFEDDDLPDGYPPCELLRRDGWACVVC
jgi:ribosomal protein L11 methyltransferase